MSLIHAINTAPQKPGIKNIIFTEVFTSLPNSLNPFAHTSVAIWDTGATHTTICTSLVTALGLLPVGVRNTHTANGSNRVNTFLVDLVLPNRVRIPAIEVSEADFTAFTSPTAAPLQVLIGMDIINLGDFSITNFKGDTVMNFRIPSIEEHDYVFDAKKRNKIAELKNARSSSLKGKKKRSR